MDYIMNLFILRFFFGEIASTSVISCVSFRMLEQSVNCSDLPRYQGLQSKDKFQYEKKNNLLNSRVLYINCVLFL